MSPYLNIPKRGAAKPKRDWFDWLSDNFGKVLIAAAVCNMLFWGSIAYIVATNASGIAREAGELAGAAAEGFNSSQKRQGGSQ